MSASGAGVLLLAGFVLERVAGLEWGQSLVWASLAIGMVHGVRAALESVRELSFDIDVLMVIGAGLAAAIGAPAEGALLLFLFVLAGSLEGLAMARTRRAIEALHTLMPTAAMRWDAAQEAWTKAEPESLVAGDRVKVLPGELVPTDARIVAGETALNQASLTGESLPRIARPGDEVYAGTINVGNAFEAEVLRPVRESSLQRVLDLVMEAQSQREPVQRVIDRLNQPYAVGVMVLSVLVFLVWWLAFGEPVFDVEAGGRGALYTAITLLIVMSPCAVIISTPTATLAAIARGARAGVLFKGGQSIDRLARVRAIALDKTGTLTVGRPRVQQVHPVGWSDAEELLSVAAGLEQDSTHPIAAAIREAAERRGVPAREAVRTTFTPGRGVSGVFDGTTARLGTYEHAEEVTPVCLRARVREVLGKVQARGQIGTVIAWKGQAGVIVMMDEIRPGAAGLVEELHALGIRPVVMLTGDNRKTAQHVAEAVGLDAWEAELMPEHKVAEVKRLRRETAEGSGGMGRGGKVGVVGDGVNDAPALSAADVSIAIGSIGSDAALESADIVLLGEDLGAVPWAVRLARRTRWTVGANLTFALGAIAVMAVVTLVGSRTGFELPLWAGVLGHEGGTLLVVANSLLLLAFGRPQRNEAAFGTSADESSNPPILVGSDAGATNGAARVESATG